MMDLWYVKVTMNQSESHKVKTLKYLALAVFVCAFLPDSMLSQKTASTNPVLSNYRKDFFLLVNAPTSDSLKVSYSSIKSKSYITKMIYAFRALELNPKKENEILLLRAMPQTENEWSTFYELCKSPLNDKEMDEKLNRIACDYYDRAAKALLKNKRFVASFYRFGEVTQGEMTEIYATCCSWLVEQSCVWFLRSLEQSNQATQERILGVLDLDPPNTECISKNKLRIPKKYLQHFGVE